jgi:signal transduction histidine kinase
MKLLNLTNRYYIIIALALLLVSSTFLAYRVIYMIDTEISEHMLFEKQEIEKQLAIQKEIQGIPLVIGDRIQITPIDKFTTIRTTIRDTTLYDFYYKKQVPYRMISYEQLINGKGYYISLARRLTESERLFEGVSIALLLVALDIIICFYFLNRWFSSKIWNPFYRALNVLKNFDLQKGGNTRFQRSKVDEFNAMNIELAKLTDKVTRDYKNLKEFTENMSHETQTPLAIIRSKLELILQSENLNEEQIQHILSTLDSVNRLSKMNKGLIMLTRIDNEQFTEMTYVHPGEIIRQQLRDLDLFISSREINVHTTIDDRVEIRMNSHLAQILITNLLSNAIKYNVNGGHLYITLNREKVVIANSGEPPTIPVDQIFDRFKKGESPDSVGLGLAIVRRITEHFHGRINYDYVNGLHTFTIDLPSSKPIFSGTKEQAESQG